MRVALTGATGLLGRNLLYELLLRTREVSRIVVLGRPGEHGLAARVTTLLASDGSAYLGSYGLRTREVLAFADARVDAVELDLEDPRLGLDPRGERHLAWLEIDTLVHVAATDADGTARLVDLAARLGWRRLFHVGSAFASGRMDGYVRPDDLVLDGDGLVTARQRASAAAEARARRLAPSLGLELAVVRPALLCGRLLENPRGAVSTFGGLLGWARGLERAARAIGRGPDGRARVPLRLAMHPDGGLNLVPVDFCAKVLAEAVVGGAPAPSFHLANPVATPHRQYARRVADRLRLDGLEIVDERPRDPTPLERRFYEDAGDAFAPWIERPPLVLETMEQRALEERIDVRCPRIDAPALDDLLRYAVERRFGDD